MVAFSRLAVALSTVSSIAAFTPTLSRPKQCSPFAISWSTSMLGSLVAPSSAVTPPTSISISFVPVSSSQNTYTVSVPCNPNAEQEEQAFLIEALPFPHGSQIYAEVHVPGVKGVLTRRRISDIWTVGDHPIGDDSCLYPTAPLGKRQVNVVGPSFIDANVVEPEDTIDVETDASSSSSAPAAATTGGVPPIKVIGSSTIPIDGVPEAPETPETPENAASPPPSRAPVPPIKEIGFTTIPIEGAAPPTEETTDETTEEITEELLAPPTEEGYGYEYGSGYEEGYEYQDGLQFEEEYQDDAQYEEEHSYVTVTDAVAPTGTEEHEVYPTEYSEGEYVDEENVDEEHVEEESVEAPYLSDEHLSFEDTYYEDETNTDVEETDIYEPSPETAYDDSVYDPTADHVEDADAWLEDYYGSGDWIKVDDEGADSYLGESTAVKYESVEEMVKHANKKYKAWNPANLVAPASESHTTSSSSSSAYAAPTYAYAYPPRR